MNNLRDRILLSLLCSLLVLIGTPGYISAQISAINSKEINERLKSIDLIMEAGKRSEKKDWRGAMLFVNRAIANDSSRPPTLAIDYSFRADLWAEMGYYQNSLADFGRAMKLNPAETYSSYGEQARVRVKFHDLDKALADAEKALELKGDDDGCIQIRGEVRYARKEYDMAIADYTRSMELSKYKFYAGFKLRAEAYRRQGKVKLAEADEKLYNEGRFEDFAIMIKGGPGLASDAPRGYRRRGEYRSGLSQEHSAIGPLPTRMTEYNEAIEDFTSALKLNPKDRLALKDRAQVYRILGMTDLAQADEKAYLALASRRKRTQGH